MASIYNISPYKTNSTYNKNDIVSSNGLFYYSKIDSNKNNTPSVTSAQWGGTINIKTGTDSGGSDTYEERPYFFWSPSYGASVSQQPRIQEIQFGDGYIQRLADGVHNNLLTFNLNFNLRNLSEVTAIIHFLSSKDGHKPFYFKAIAPYSVIKKFVCLSWSTAMEFDDNHNVQATFEESA